MCDIPSVFPVRDCYLHGMVQADFCAAFIALQKIVMEIYAHIEQYPEAAGLATVSKTGTKKVQSSQNIAGIKKLLYTIGLWGKSFDDALVAPMRDVMNFYMLTFADYGINPKTSLSSYYKEYDDAQQRKFFEKKHMQLLFNCLEKFGFAVELDENVTIRYPDNPNVLRVLHEFATLRVCRNRFRFEFAKFNHRVFAYERDERVALEDLYSTNNNNCFRRYTKHWAQSLASMLLVPMMFRWAVNTITKTIYALTKLPARIYTCILCSQK